MDAHHSTNNTGHAVRHEWRAMHGAPFMAEGRSSETNDRRIGEYASPLRPYKVSPTEILFTPGRGIFAVCQNGPMDLFFAAAG